MTIHSANRQVIAEIPDILLGEVIEYSFFGECDGSHLWWSKETVDKFDISDNETEYHIAIENLLHPRDLEFFKKVIEGQKQQELGEYRFKLKNGEYQWKKCTIKQVEKNGRDYVAGIIYDLHTEDVSNMPSAVRGTNVFRLSLADITHQEAPCGIMVVGLDEFNNINELYSYGFGDDMLHIFYERAVEVLPPHVGLYQLDGVDFGLIYPQATRDDMIKCFRAMQQIAKNLAHPTGIDLPMTPTGGICYYPQNGINSETLYRNVRLAYKEAKEQGKNQAIIYTEELSKRTSYTMRLLAKLRESANKGFEGFSLTYQPLMYASNTELYGCEVLLRWKHPEFPEGVPTTTFIPILEKSGLIVDVGKWILDQSFKQCKKWSEKVPDFQMSINVAFEQFEQSDFIHYVMQSLAKYKLDPQLITLELTESGQITNTDLLNRSFEFLRSQGIKIALDDFGTGYDSLSTLRVLSADELKIDRSFLERITYNVTDQKIITQIINLCESMNMSVCVEGIENQEIEKVVKQLGAKLLQGFYYNKPLNPELFEKIYLKNYAEEGDKEKTAVDTEAHPEIDQSMVYSTITPSQTISMTELIDLAHAGIFQVGLDQSFTFLSCNEGYRRMLGYTAKEIETKFKNKALAFVYPDDVEYVNEEIRRQLGIGDLVFIEFRLVRADGTAVWVLGTGNVARGSHGNSSLVVVIIDNDKNKRRNLAMEISYLQYKKILDNVPTGIKCVRFDKDFTLDYISPGFLSVLGYSEGDIGKYFDWKYINMIYEEDRAQVINNVLEQTKMGDIITLRYRSLCKDGRLIWLETVTRLCPRDEDGDQRCFSSVVDITDSISDEEKNHTHSLANRFQSALKQWGDVLFEYKFKTDSITFSENFYNTFGRKPQEHLKEELRFLHPHDRVVFQNILKSVAKGNQPKETEIQILNGDGKYLWCSVIFNKADYLGDTPVAAIGKISNIDYEKREKELLIKQSQLDPLTGLLNKSALEEKIRELLFKLKDKECSGALFMFDLDDFKWVNDNLGHLYGDELLKEVGRRLKCGFTKDAIVGRAGGDEFMVFLPHINTHEDLKKKASTLIEKMNETFCFDDMPYEVRLSIGISRYPKDADNFYDLFRKADSALYRIKLHNKNDYCIYSV